jgi:hypothetical protein
MGKEQLSRNASASQSHIIAKEAGTEKLAGVHMCLHL